MALPFHGIETIFMIVVINDVDMMAIMIMSMACGDENESKPGTDGPEPHPHPDRGGTPVPQERFRCGQRLGGDEGRGVDPWRLLWAFQIEGRSDRPRNRPCCR